MGGGAAKVQVLCHRGKETLQVEHYLNTVGVHMALDSAISLINIAISQPADRNHSFSLNCVRSAGLGARTSL